MAHKGTLIVIEGGDSSGKETQTAALKTRLEAAGHTVHTASFPEYDQNVIGKLIGECLRGERGEFLGLDARVVSVLYAADRFESLPQIEKRLAAGDIVILDRYTTANMLHQGAKIADDARRKETIEWIYNLEHTVFKLPIPDVVIYLKVPARVRAELQTKRKGADDDAEKNLEHQQAVDERAPSILGMYEHTYTIECMSDDTIRSVDDIAEEIFDLVEEK